MCQIRSIARNQEGIHQRNFPCAHQCAGKSKGRDKSKVSLKDVSRPRLTGVTTKLVRSVAVLVPVFAFHARQYLFPPHLTIFPALRDRPRAQKCCSPRHILSVRLFPWCELERSSEEIEMKMNASEDCACRFLKRTRLRENEDAKSMKGKIMEMQNPCMLARDAQRCTSGAISSRIALRYLMKGRVIWSLSLLLPSSPCKSGTHLHRSTCIISSCGVEDASSPAVLIRSHPALLIPHVEFPGSLMAGSGKTRLNDGFEPKTGFDGATPMQ